MTKYEEIPDRSNLVVVEGANFAWKSNRITEQKLPQQRRKTEFIFDTFARMQIDAVGIGEGEAALGLDWIVQTAKAKDIPILASNVSCETLDFPHVQRRAVSGVTIGILSVLREGSSIDGCTVLPVVDRVKNIMADESSVDVWVVLSMLNEAEQLQLAETVPDIDFIVDGYTKALLDKPKPLANDTLRLSMGSRGKYFGVLNVHTEDARLGHQLLDSMAFYEAEVTRLERRLESLQSNTPEDEIAEARQARRVTFFTKELEAAVAARDAQAGKETTGNTVLLTKFELSKSVADHPATSAALNLTLQDIENLAQAETVEPYSGPFVGAAACEQCHSEIYSQWVETPHAHAWTTLVNEKRAFDLECYACHSTGAHHPEGPQHPKQVGTLIGVGCESCHGPGQAHLAQPSAANIQRSVEESLCVTCHDGVKDEGRFDFESYYPKIEHHNERSGN